MAKETAVRIVSDDPRAYAVTRGTAEIARKVWAQPLWRGILALAGGVCLLAWPDDALSWVLWIVLGLLVVDAVITLIAASTSNKDKGSRVAVSALAIAGVLAGIAAVIWTDETSDLLRYGLAVTVIVGGIISVIGALREKHRVSQSAWALRLAAGVMAVLFGGIVLLRHSEPDAVFANLAATFFVMFAVVQLDLWLVQTLDRRQLEKAAKEAPAAPASPAAPAGDPA